MAQEGAGRSRWWLIPVLTLIVGLVITATLADISHRVYERNQQHLLDLRARDAGSLLTAALPDLQTTLAAAAEVAAATDGSVGKFRSFVQPYVAAGPQHQFVTVTLWRLDAAASGPLTVVGAKPKLSAAGAAALFAEGPATPGLRVVGLLKTLPLRLGFGYAAAASDGDGYAAYAETPLPANHRSPIGQSSAFAGLNYSLYLGPSVRAQDLLLTSSTQLPLSGRRATVRVPFGDTSVTLQMFARGSLTGALPRDLPWIILFSGVLLSLMAALGALLLNRRRQLAEQFAGENRRLYAEQRSIAQTLQHALLPDRLPAPRGVETDARYAAGERSVDIGGDWYDVIERPADRALLVVGDVSGRGLRAATTMASLRYALRAYAAQNDTPPAILGKLAQLLNVSEDGQFATVLCVEVAVAEHSVTVTSAGHLPPLLIGPDQAIYLPATIGLPIGVDGASTYQAMTVSVPAGSTLLAFSDGLVERRGEDLEQGLTRLQEMATEASLKCDSLGALLDTLVRNAPDSRASDDIAIVGLRWTS